MEVMTRFVKNQKNGETLCRLNINKVLLY